MLAYADKKKLWNDPHILMMIELIATEFYDNDWDTIDECFNSESFLRMMAMSKQKCWQREWKFYCDQVNDY
jgi:hypothetical protein